jgi:hypothetical protein
MSGHLDVGDEQVESPALHRVHRRAPVFRHRDVISFTAQHDRQQLAHRPLIVDNEHSCGCGAGLRRRLDFYLLHKWGQTLFLRFL